MVGYMHAWDLAFFSSLGCFLESMKVGNGKLTSSFGFEWFTRVGDVDELGLSAWGLSALLSYLPFDICIFGWSFVLMDG